MTYNALIAMNTVADKLVASVRKHAADPTVVPTNNEPCAAVISLLKENRATSFWHVLTVSIPPTTIDLVNDMHVQIKAASH